MCMLWRVPACFSGFLLNGERDTVIDGRFLCGPTRGRWVLLESPSQVGSENGTQRSLA